MGRAHSNKFLPMVEPVSLVAAGRVPSAGLMQTAPKGSALMESCKDASLLDLDQLCTGGTRFPPGGSDNCLVTIISFALAKLLRGQRSYAEGGLADSHRHFRDEGKRKLIRAVIENIFSLTCLPSLRCTLEIGGEENVDISRMHKNHFPR